MSRQVIQEEAPRGTAQWSIIDFPGHMSGKSMFGDGGGASLFLAAPFCGPLEALR
jgi:hypothetical protein